ncbi:MFS transporter [Actinomadura parmotrematis]|uniref:MFS transporter n=1 Tax=Actinomadura parmotrematis TaxID=2864039 RepID=A0ABS7G102_9ACTN|nr:MFS transporter [Actinomadura parmotrematis]MBW8486394.1 MFS transporter [Actinomadura parmotrematis]
MITASLPRSVRLGYGAGSFCAGTFNSVPGLLLLYYMTNTLGTPAWAAGLAVFLPKPWDLVVGPLVGRLSDRSASRRPWLLAGAVLLPGLFVLLFAGTPLRGTAAAVYVGVCFLLTSSVFALFEVPYKAMPAEMTSDYHEQSSLLTWRMVFLGLATLLAGGLAPALVNVHGGDPTIEGYRLMGLVIGCVLLAAMLATYFGTARAPRAGADEGTTTLREQWRAARANKPYLRLTVFGSVQLAAVSMLLAAAPYLAAYSVGDPGSITTLFLAFIAPMLIAMPAWVRVSRRYDKRGAMFIAGALFATGGLLSLGIPAGGQVWAHLCVVVTGVGFAGLQMLQFSMLADTLHYDELRTGRRRAGMLTGLWTAVEAVIGGLGGLLYGWILSGAGFVPSEPDEPVVQPDSAVHAVLIGGTLVPALLMILALVLALRYRLTADDLERLRDAAHNEERA